MQQQLQPYMKYSKVVQPAPPSNPDQHEIRVTTSKPPKIYVKSLTSRMAIFLCTVTVSNPSSFGS